jgi:hypothetical protein
MPYTLVPLAPGIYDLVLDGKIIGSVVRNETRQAVLWTAELLENLPCAKRPAPFSEIEHEFPTLEQVRAWLGNPVIQSQ